MTPSDLNPFAPPKVDADPPPGGSPESDDLVVPRGTLFPRRCARCDAADIVATRTPLILAASRGGYSRRGAPQLGLCRPCNDGWRTAIAILWATLLCFFALLFWLRSGRLGVITYLLLL